MQRSAFPAWSVPDGQPTGATASPLSPPATATTISPSASPVLHPDCFDVACGLEPLSLQPPPPQPPPPPQHPALFAFGDAAPAPQPPPQQPPDRAAIPQLEEMHTRRKNIHGTNDSTQPHLVRSSCATHPFGCSRQTRRCWLCHGGVHTMVCFAGRGWQWIRIVQRETADGAEITIMAS